MILSTEALGDIEMPTPGDIERFLSEDSFGKFAVLARSETDFIQAGNNWSPSENCKAFLKLHESDPWVLEYRDGEVGRMFRAIGDLALEQVKQVFLSYLAGGSGWRKRFEWAELDT